MNMPKWWLNVTCFNELYLLPTLVQTTPETCSPSNNSAIFLQQFVSCTIPKDALLHASPLHDSYRGIFLSWQYAIHGLIHARIPDFICHTKKTTIKVIIDYKNNITFTRRKSLTVSQGRLFYRMKAPFPKYNIHTRK